MAKTSRSPAEARYLSSAPAEIRTPDLLIRSQRGLAGKFFTELPYRTIDNVGE